MPKFTIKKGTHRAKPLRFGFWYKKKEISRTVIFHRSARYFLLDKDQEDTNKLYGLGFFKFNQIFGVIKGFFSQKYIPDVLHHTDSVRIGWVYDTELDKMVLYSYVYINGERRIKELLKVPFETKVNTKIEIEDYSYTFTISYDSIFSSNRIAIDVPHGKKWSYYLGLYFGGNKTPNSDLEVTINKN